MKRRKKFTTTKWTAVHAAPGPDGWAVAAVLPVEGEPKLKVGFIDYGDGHIFPVYPAVVELLIKRTRRG
jgi:hypothetical protein